MEPTAFVAALTSTLAIGLTIVLLRMMRLDRQRSDARVAALVTLAHTPASTPAPSIAFEHPPLKLERRPAPQAMPAARRVAREPQKLAPVRLSAADVDIFRDASAFAPAAHVSTAAPELFEPALPRTGSHLLYVGVGALVMVTLITLGFRWAVSGAPAPTTETSASLGAAGAPAAVAQPLGLVALRHEQSADGTLVISGVVRNPADSIGREKLFAAASLVDAAGTLVASARAPLDFTTLAPGEESPFVVRIASANGVARYRIGFRDADGNAVAHIDRR